MFGNLVIPISFHNQEIQVSEKRKHEIIQPNNDKSLWAVREITPGFITVGYFEGDNVDLYHDGELVRSINCGVGCFGFILPPQHDSKW